MGDGVASLCPNCVMADLLHFSFTGLSNGFNHDKVMAVAAAWAKKIHQLDDGDGYQFEVSTRIGRSFVFHQNPKKRLIPVLQCLFLQ